ncbi:prolipoprotein diacylglyceryl transferase [Seonamhaeicola sp. MEBiC1930]|uniref:prolipoprotein diacylglyceryl transferase n=1 Tax=Seonamhaeicola sp. MEBiC01930 TaxID=2976768 RepID=UPI003255C738
MFPELFNIDFNGFLGIETITISTYAVCIVLGALIATKYAKITAKKELGVSLSNNLVYLIFIAGYAGGKVFLYLEKPLFYLNNPDEILNTFSGGFVFYGSFLFIVPTIFWYLKKYQLPVLPLLDVAAVSVVIVQVLGRLGCFFAGCCYGEPTNHFFGVSFPATPSLAVHPTQLYESSILLLFLIFLFLFKNYKHFNGQLFLIYISFYGVSRIIIEIFRGDVRGQFVEGVLSHSQGIAIVLIILSAIAYYKKKKTINSKLIL